MIPNQYETIHYQVALTLLRQMKQKQLVITAALSKSLESAQSLPEIHEMICIMSKLAKMEEENNEYLISTASPKDYCRFVRRLLFICFFSPKIKYTFQELLSISMYISKSQSIDSQIGFIQLKHQIDRLLAQNIPHLSEYKSMSIIRLLTNQFQAKIKEAFAGNISINEMKDYLLEQIKVVQRCIRRLFDDNSILRIQFIQRMKHILLGFNHYRVEFKEWKQIGFQNKCRFIQEGLDFAFASQIPVTGVIISDVIRQQYVLIYRVLQKYPQIQFLYLAQCELGNQIMPILKYILCLKFLNLGFNRINDAGVKQLSEVKYQQLAKLVICSNPVTNKGLHYLAKADWPCLAYLSLKNCPVTKDGVKLYTKLAFRNLVLRILHLSVQIRNNLIRIKGKDGVFYKVIRQPFAIHYYQQ